MDIGIFASLLTIVKNLLGIFVDVGLVRALFVVGSLAATLVFWKSNMPILAVVFLICFILSVVYCIIFTVRKRKNDEIGCGCQSVGENAVSRLGGLEFSDVTQSEGHGANGRQSVGKKAKSLLGQKYSGIKQEQK